MWHNRLCVLPCVPYCVSMNTNRRRYITRTLHAVTLAAIGAAMAVTGMTYDAPAFPDVEAGVTPGDVTAWQQSLPANVPTWTNTDHAADRTRCTPADVWNDATGAARFIPATLILSTREGITTRVRYTDTLTRTVKAHGANQTPADDMYVIGACK